MQFIINLSNSPLLWKWRLYL
uniref:Uncharacterized protein n=1 Tax=Anguilla anguilla TaxID=7936 RepID=A0A0E9XIR1_ANGAN